MPRIYFANLAAYNAGHLKGAWLDAGDVYDVGDIREHAAAVAAGGDWAAHDYEDFPNMGEHPSCEEIAAVIEVAREHSGRDLDEDILFAVEHFLTDVASGPEDLPSEFEDAFAGIWDSELEYAENFIDDCYDLDRLMGNMARYFDYERFASDLFMSDMSSLDLPSGMVAIFRNC